MSRRKPGLVTFVDGGIHIYDRRGRLMVRMGCFEREHKPRTGEPGSYMRMLERYREYQQLHRGMRYSYRLGAIEHQQPTLVPFCSDRWKPEAK